MKGRKTIPINIMRAKGTLKKHRIKNVPDPSDKRPISPSWLNKRAKQIFWHMTNRLNDIGLASRTHTEAIAALSSRMEEVERFDKILNDEGYFYNAKNSLGFEVKKEHPAAKLREKAIRHVHSLLTEFGLTPASIQKVGSTKKKPRGNDFEGF